MLQRLRQPQAVTSLQLINDTNLASAGADGSVAIWDLRKPNAPLKHAVVDGSPVIKLAASPIGDCLAVATQRSLVTLDLLDASCETTPMVTSALQQPYLDVTWNVHTNELYAACGTGAVSVFTLR